MVGTSYKGGWILPVSPWLLLLLLITLSSVSFLLQDWIHHRVIHIAIMKVSTTSLWLGALLTSLGQVGATKAPINLNLKGHINPDQVYSFVYVPFQVPFEATSIYVLQNYSSKGAGNALDLGVFDPRGTHIEGALNQSTGFRGWSGGFRNNFTISPESATPAYIAGAIDPGEWNVVLGPYVSLPEGIDYELNVTIGFEPVKSYFQPSFASNIVGTGYAGANQSDDTSLDAEKGKWYRGDLHMHTYYSDGKYSPQEIIDYALRRQLAFIFSTDHNTQASGLIWGALAPPNLLIGRGIEVTTRNGHWGALGLEWDQWVEFRYRNNSSPGLPEAKQQVRRAGGFVSINHPFSACSACNWTYSYGDFDGIEVWNGPWDPTDEMAVSKWQELLVAGVYITAVGGSDAHKDPDVVGLPTTVVRASELSSAAVLRGLHKRRAYLVRDPGMDIQFSVKAQGNAVFQVGDRVQAKGEVTATVHTTGLDGATVVFVSEGGAVHQETIKAGCDIKYQVDKARFVRVEVRDAQNNMLGLTNPIFLR